MKKCLHLVAFNVPAPPDYGGVIDVYYRIEALHRAGIGVILHCFEYGRPHSPALERLCEQVFYYRRKTGWASQFSLKPYIVNSRNHPDLLKNLLAVQAPVLFEGLHCCYFLNHPALKNYRKLVRMHNIEHQYYFNLWTSESNPRDRLFLLIESLRLRHFEGKLRAANAILSISTRDTESLQSRYRNVVYLPAFHPFAHVVAKPGQGDYLLFHGDLTIAENQQTVRLLLRKVFSEITVSFVVAGKNPPEWMIRQISNIPHVSLVANPSEAQMNQLISEAQICLVPAYRPSGLKIKLLTSLFEGRHCLTNQTMVLGTGLNDLCHLAETSQELIEQITRLMEVPFTEADIENRIQKLETYYSNDRNAQNLIELL